MKSPEKGLFGGTVVDKKSSQAVDGAVVVVGGTLCF